MAALAETSMKPCGLPRDWVRGVPEQNVPRAPQAYRVEHIPSCKQTAVFLTVLPFNRFGFMWQSWCLEVAKIFSKTVFLEDFLILSWRLFGSASPKPPNLVCGSAQDDMLTFSPLSYAVDCDLKKKADDSFLPCYYFLF